MDTESEFVKKVTLARVNAPPPIKLVTSIPSPDFSEQSIHVEPEKTPIDFHIPVLLRVPITTVFSTVTLGSFSIFAFSTSNLAFATTFFFFGATVSILLFVGALRLSRTLLLIGGILSGVLVIIMVVFLGIMLSVLAISIRVAITNNLDSARYVILPANQYFDGTLNPLYPAMHKYYRRGSDLQLFEFAKETAIYTTEEVPEFPDEKAWAGDAFRMAEILRDVGALCYFTHSNVLWFTKWESVDCNTVYPSDMNFSTIDSLNEIDQRKAFHHLISVGANVLYNHFILSWVAINCVVIFILVINIGLYVFSCFHGICAFVYCKRKSP